MTAYDHLELDRLSFGAVVNDVPADTPLPVEIGGWELDWARPDELEGIVHEFRAFAAPHEGAPQQEMMLIPQVNGVRYEEANPQDWRYCVVRRTPSAVLPAFKLAEALRISEADLWVETWMPARVKIATLRTWGWAVDRVLWVNTFLTGSPGRCFRQPFRFRTLLRSSDLGLNLMRLNSRASLARSPCFAISMW